MYLDISTVIVCICIKARALLVSALSDVTPTNIEASTASSASLTAATAKTEEVDQQTQVHSLHYGPVAQSSVKSAWFKSDLEVYQT